MKFKWGRTLLLGFAVAFVSAVFVMILFSALRLETRLSPSAYRGAMAGLVSVPCMAFGLLYGRRRKK